MGKKRKNPNEEANKNLKLGAKRVRSLYEKEALLDGQRRPEGDGGGDEKVHERMNKYSYVRKMFTRECDSKQTHSP